MDDPARPHHGTLRGPVVSAGVVLGIGLGGFVDGILFHQLLQVHSMLSARVLRDDVVGLEINMFWDGMFHVATWLATVIGVAMLFRAGERPDVVWSRRLLAAGLAIGWGLFNLVEGIIDHHVLHLHHVVERLGESAWDVAFLASGVLLLSLGWLLLQPVSTVPRPLTRAPSA